MVKNLSYKKFNTVNAYYLLMDKINGRIEESNENEYLKLFPMIRKV